MDLGGLPKIPNWIMRVAVWLMVLGLLVCIAVGLGLAAWSLSHLQWK